MITDPQEYEDYVIKKLNEGMETALDRFLGIINNKSIDKDLFHYNGIPLIQLCKGVYIEFRWRDDSSERIIHEVK